MMAAIDSDEVVIPILDAILQDILQLTSAEEFKKQQKDMDSSALENKEWQSEEKGECDHTWERMTDESWKKESLNCYSTATSEESKCATFKGNSNCTFEKINFTVEENIYATHDEKKDCTGEENNHCTFEENICTTLKENSNRKAEENSCITIDENKDCTVKGNRCTAIAENINCTVEENNCTFLVENSNSSIEGNSDTTVKENDNGAAKEKSRSTHEENDCTVEENSGTTIEQNKNERDFQIPADVALQDNESVKDSFMNRIGLETKNISQDTSIEMEHNIVREQQKKESVHFGSPIASYHEYYVSQDTCTQSLSEIDPSDSPCSVESLKDDFETSEKLGVSENGAENVKSNQTIIMTPAGDCSNSKVNSLMHNVQEACLVEELPSNVIKTASEEDGNKCNKFVLINPFIEEIIDKLISEDSATEKSVMLMSENNTLSRTNSSPDLFEDSVSDSDEVLSVSQTVLDKCSLDEKNDSSIKDDVTPSMKEEDLAKQAAEKVIHKIQFEAGHVVKQKDDDLKSDTQNSNRDFLTESIPSDSNEIQVANADHQSQTDEQTNRDISATCVDIVRCETAECSSSQDLFLDTDNREGDGSFDADTQLLGEDEEESPQQEQLSQNACSLYCDESLDVKDDFVDSQSNKRSLACPASPTSPSKKPKLDADGHNNSQGARVLKRVMPSLENSEEFSSSKKSNLSSDLKHSNSASFFPETLKSIASENLGCLQEEILWRKEVDQESQGSVPSVNDFFLLAPDEILAAGPCEENINLELAIEQKDNVQEQDDTNIMSESEIVQGTNGASEETNKVDEQINNNELHDTSITCSQTKQTEDESDNSNACQAGDVMLHDSNNYIEDGDLNKSNDCDEVVTDVLLQSVHSLNAEDKSEDQCNVYDATFISATEYLSQSSQGSSTGFTYDKNISPQWICQSQEVLSLNTDVPVHPSEDEQVCEACNDNPVITQSLVEGQLIRGTVELASENGQNRKILDDIPGSTQASIDDQLEKGETVELTAEEGLCGNTYDDHPGTADVSAAGQPDRETVEIAAEPDNEVDIDTLDMMVVQAIDHIVPDDDELTADGHPDNPDDCSMFDKTEEKENKFYSCDLDLCDEEDRPLCSPVDKRRVKSDLSVPSSSTSCFKWRYAPSCDTDTNRPVRYAPSCNIDLDRPVRYAPSCDGDGDEAVGEMDMEDTIVKITPIHTCNKPLRLGLSKKRQPLHRLHKF